MKIYDCFTFFNELDLLEIRLNILNDYVDYFVLVEATKTHSGKPKELFYKKNKNKFKNFNHKIIHIIVDDMPNIKNDDRWVLERYQRDQIVQGLTNCKDSDIVIVSDLDEIPNPKKINLAIKSLYKQDILTKIKRKLNKNYFSIRFIQKLYYYYLNGYANKPWKGSVLTQYKTINHLYNNINEFYVSSKKNKNIKNGGWHFSYLGGVDLIITKLKSFAHSEFDGVFFTNPEKIKTCIENGYDISGREKKIKYIKIDSTYPDYITNNISKYSYYIKSY